MECRIIRREPAFGARATDGQLLPGHDFQFERARHEGTAEPVLTRGTAWSQVRMTFSFPPGVENSCETRPSVTTRTMEG